MLGAPLPMPWYLAPQTFLVAIDPWVWASRCWHLPWYLQVANRQDNQSDFHLQEKFFWCLRHAPRILDECENIYYANDNTTTGIRAFKRKSLCNVFNQPNSYLYVNSSFWRWVLQLRLWVCLCVWCLSLLEKENSLSYPKVPKSIESIAIPMHPWRFMAGKK